MNMFLTLSTIATTLFFQCSNCETNNLRTDINVSKLESQKTDNNSSNKSDSTTFDMSSYCITADDSLKVQSLITEATAQLKLLINNNIDNDDRQQKLLLYIARKFIGVPYVGKTLEINDKEKLVVNLHELDCTTYVETVLAIYMTVIANCNTINGYMNNLRKVRYIDGQIDYGKRQHYFTIWIEQNHKKGIVSEIQSMLPPYTAIQTISADYMSTHTSLYPMLRNNPNLISTIKQMEKNIKGRKYRYIPKEKISNTTLLKQTIHDGDIIAIVTRKKGLDTSHIGIAVWHNDGLHLLNASQIHKKVVEEPMTLKEYMSKHPSQMGIRIIRVNKR